ncbi:MAG TPA: hypothetical protein VK452_07160, partial [Dissulfurispiraceae bacterium]|nr:hypothetical protein [Dissulfurispiraceae bacterium]
MILAVKSFPRNDSAQVRAASLNLNNKSFVTIDNENIRFSPFSRIVYVPQYGFDFYLNNILVEPKSPYYKIFQSPVKIAFHGPLIHLLVYLFITARALFFLRAVSMLRNVSKAKRIASARRLYEFNRCQTVITQTHIITPLYALFDRISSP